MYNFVEFTEPRDELDHPVVGPECAVIPLPASTIDALLPVESLLQAESRLNDVPIRLEQLTVTNEETGEVRILFAGDRWHGLASPGD
jgi:hypothetical protein